MAKRKRKDISERLEAAYAFIGKNLTVSLRAVALAHDIGKTALYRRVYTAPTKKTIIGRLTVPEKTTLYRYIDRLKALNLIIRKYFVTTAINNLLRDRLRLKKYILIKEK